MINRDEFLDVFEQVLNRWLQIGAASGLVNDSDNVLFCKAENMILAARARGDEYQARALDCDYLESIASSLLHGHEQNVVDWEAFRALEQYFAARENPNDH